MQCSSVPRYKEKKYLHEMLPIYPRKKRENIGWLVKYRTAIPFYCDFCQIGHVYTTTAFLTSCPDNFSTFSIPEKQRMVMKPCELQKECKRCYIL